MRTFVLACLLACLLAAAESQDKYPSQFDNLNLDEILGNNRTLDSYIKCLLGKGGCTPPGKALKDNLPDALATGCADCSDSHRSMVKKVLALMKVKKPAEMKQVMDVYDPNGEYRAKYGEYLERFPDERSS
ncbi:ejaculatory bulb-specific protein 3-like [Bacillus rossius redtenbacheri]|uniref:ejaculatory bulb-specific protein 3-like n=1 Tax=Bacillus rossius redtenbacheri TaxID=93214 RepID=UPI002FDD3D5D